MSALFHSYVRFLVSRRWAVASHLAFALLGAAIAFRLTREEPLQDQITGVTTSTIGVEGQPAQVPYVQPPKEAVDHAVQGYHHQVNKKYAEALAEYNAALQIYSDYPDAHWNKALIHHQLQQYSQAVQSYREMLKLNPSDIDALYNMGYALDKLGRYSEALDVYAKILEIDPNDVHAPIGKGIAYYHLGNFDGAIAEFSRVIESNPKYALYSLSCMYAQKGDTAQALEYFRKARPHLDAEQLKQAATDSDLTSLQPLPEFQELLRAN